MKKRLIVTAIFLFVTAALLATLFICNLNIGYFLDSDDGTGETQPIPDYTGTMDLLLVLGLIPSFGWPLLVIAFVVIGILLLVCLPENLNGWLIAAIIFGAIGFAPLGLALLLLMPAYVLFVPLFAILAAVLMVTYIATFVLICVSKAKLKNYICGYGTR